MRRKNNEKVNSLDIHDVELQKRFWDKVRIIPGECWLWQDNLCAGGYGRLPISRSLGKEVYAHALAYRLVNKVEIPEDKQINHYCNVKSCCNPEHLYKGTQYQNVQDTVNIGNARGGSFPGEKNPNAKLTESQVKEIKYRHKNGEKVINLAEEFNVDRHSISRIHLQKAWKHVN